MKVLTILILFYSSFAFAQSADNDVPLPFQDGKVTYSEIVNVDSATKNQLYSRAKEWISRSFKSSKTVIQLDEKEDGKLALRASLDGYNDFYLSLSLKDFKFKYQITDIECIVFIGEDKRHIETIYKDYLDGKRKKGYGLILKGVDKQIKSLLVSLKTQMAKSSLDDGF